MCANLSNPIKNSLIALERSDYRLTRWYLCRHLGNRIDDKSNRSTSEGHGGKVRSAVRILQVNTYDLGGGAAAVSRGLHINYRRLGEEARLAVGRMYGNDPDTFQLDPFSEAELSKTSLSRIERTKRLAHRAKSPDTYRNAWRRARGRDVLNYRATWRLFDEEPEVVQCHNLHGHYFDLKALPGMGEKTPIVLTLHDCWLLGGHCAHSFGCERWKTGCGNCPDLQIPSPIKRDGSSANFAERRKVFSQFDYHVATPCQWLMGKVEGSLLADRKLDGRVIPNGVNLSIFHPGSGSEARSRLGLEQDRKIVLHAGAYARTSPWRDYNLLEKALMNLDSDVTLLCVGEAGEPTRLGRLEVRFVPTVSDPERMADLYRAADVYAHPAKQDTFPTTILEAMACGIPVVATSVGGIPEQVDDGRTGYLVSPGNVTAMRNRIVKLLEDENRQHAMGTRAAEAASERFDAVKQATSYVDWFQEFA